MRDRRTDIALDGIELTDVRTRRPARLCDLVGRHVVTLIRHRY